MNTPRHILPGLLATAFTTLAAHVQAPLTRADVSADYDEAVRTGDLMAPGDSGMKLNEQFPRCDAKAIADGPLDRNAVAAAVARPMVLGADVEVFSLTEG